jgi:CO/xanthine dehydrogenase Mo-binding subunit
MAIDDARVRDTQISRRRLLQGAGGLVIGFSLPAYLFAGSADAAETAIGSPDADVIGPLTIQPKWIDSWIEIGSDGRITLLTGKVELGTGVETATVQLVADELDVDPDTIDVVQADTWRTVDQSYTSGSQSMITEWGTGGARQAAAEARLALLSLASPKLGLPVGSMVVKDGVVMSATDPTQKISYADLFGGQKFNLPFSGKAKPKTAGQFSIVGSSMKRRDIPAKLKATFPYVVDVKLPGMLHGRVVRPPSIDAQLVSVDGFGGKTMPGLHKVVVVQNFVGVVCDREDQAINAAAALTCTWKTTPLPDPATFFADLRNGPTQTDRTLILTGNVDAAESAAATSVAAEYQYPYQMHAPMGASCSVADVRATTAEMWSSTQGVYQLRASLATLLNMPQQNVHVNYVEGSGCYGLNGADTTTMDAALMSQAVGAPVRAQNMRADEHAWENYGYAMVVALGGSLDANGHISRWDYEGWQTNRGNRPGPPASVITGILAGFPEAVPAKSPPPLPPLGPDSSNTVTSYTFQNHRVRNHTVGSRFLTAPLRSPARIQNTFANESFMDELAAAAKQDPVDFRLAHLDLFRLESCFRTAAAMAGWESRPSPQAPSDDRMVTGRGIAGMQYEGTGAYAAVATKLLVDKQTGKVRVQHVWAAQDCGITINPDGMRAQAEGCCLQGISRALKEELTWTKQKVTSVDWATYPVLRFTDMPEFDFHILDQPDQPPLGAGEVVITAMIASIGNAIFDATGVRLRRPPFTPARVRAGLAALKTA